jgi:subtilisin family serine protease
VIDSGVQLDHPDLAEQVDAERQPGRRRTAVVGELHGTAVAGIVAARADNQIGIAGVAPRAPDARAACLPSSSRCRRARAPASASPWG